MQELTSQWIEDELNWRRAEFCFRSLGRERHG